MDQDPPIDPWTRARFTANVLRDAFPTSYIDLDELPEPLQDTMYWQVTVRDALTVGESLWALIVHGMTVLPDDFPRKSKWTPVGGSPQVTIALHTRNPLGDAPAKWELRENHVAWSPIDTIGLLGMIRAKYNWLAPAKCTSLTGCEGQDSDVVYMPHTRLLAHLQNWDRDKTPSRYEYALKTHVEFFQTGPEPQALDPSPAHVIYDGRVMHQQLYTVAKNIENHALQELAKEGIEPFFGTWDQGPNVCIKCGVLPSPNSPLWSTPHPIQTCKGTGDMHTIADIAFRAHQVTSYARRGGKTQRTLQQVALDLVRTYGLETKILGPSKNKILTSSIKVT